MRHVSSLILLLSASCASGDTIDFSNLSCSGYLDLRGAATRGLAGDDRYLYVAHDAGIRAYELLSTMSPDPATQLPYRLVGEVAGNASQAMAVDGTHLYVAETSRVQVYDIATMPPRALGSVSAGSPLAAVVAGGGWFYFADSGGNVVQVDVRDPASPKVTNRLNPEGSEGVTHLTLHGDRLHMLNNQAFVHGYRIDADGVAYPEESLAVSFVPTGLVVAGDRLVAGARGRIATFDLSGGAAKAIGERDITVTGPAADAGPFEMKGLVVAAWGGRVIGRAGNYLVSVKVAGAGESEATALDCTGPGSNPERLVVQGDRLVIHDLATQRLTGLFPR